MTREEAAESIARNLELHEPEGAIRSLVNICQKASQIALIPTSERKRWKAAEAALRSALADLEDKPQDDESAHVEGASIAIESSSS